MGHNARAIPYLVPQIAGGGSPPINPGPAGACLLASGQTYYYPLGDDASPLASVHIKWDANVIVTFTIETCNFPIGDVANASTTAGEWMQENPTTAYASGSGSGGLTVTNLSLAVAGGSAGGSTVHIGNLGTRRARLKAVVGGTGGVVQVAGYAKA
jgi:hypothetical protein